MVDTYIESYVRDATMTRRSACVFWRQPHTVVALDLTGRFDERAVIKSAQFGVYSTAKWNSSDSIATGIYRC
jgi:hypothetical protein